jgi:alcohol dehydrogenase YqhD (iron-dependent ADH family)
MQPFNYDNPIRVHFGDGALERELPSELSRYGKSVMLAYGHGSIKKSGLYDRIVGMLHEGTKTSVQASLKRAYP